MKLKTILQLCLMVSVMAIMALAFTGCGGSSDSGDQEEASGDASGTTLKFQQWWGAELPEGYLDQVVADFQEESGITVELLTAPWADTKTAITAGAANGTIADIISVDGAWLAEFVDMGILTDIEAAGVDTSVVSDFWKVDGTGYVVPVNNFAYPMYVNMDILKDAGVDEIPATWSELLDACKKIKDSGKQAFALNLGTTNANGIQNVYGGTGWASDIKLKNDEGKYDVAGNDGQKELAEFYKEMYDNGCLYEGMATLEEAEMTSNFAAGNCAFTVASAATMSQFTDVNFETALIPSKDGYEGKHGICYASWAVGISEACENKEAAAQFVNYLLTGKDGDVSAGLASTMSAFPNSTVANPDYSEAPEQFQSFFELYKENYVINEYIGLPNASDVMTNMTNDLVKYLEGDIEVDAMLENWQGYLDNAGK
jgi:multiple sugar transport system substrate-binding protein